jgi:energy-coupling factor transporter ATP-binding protein EcfA2
MNKTSTRRSADRSSIIPNQDDVPNLLTSRDTWIPWKREERDGKETKVPCSPDGFPLSATKPANFIPFDQAVQIARDSHDVTGVGYCFTDGGPLVGVDFDDCADPDTGEVDEWALNLVEHLGTWTEYSPSTGLHSYTQGELPGKGKQAGPVEIYDSGRFFTVTGQTLDAGTGNVAEGGDVLQELYKKVSEAASDDPHPNTAKSNGTTPRDFPDVSVYEHPGISPQQYPEGKRCGHPFHKSSTNQNFHVDQGGETVRCWRHDVTYNAHQLVAVSEGIVPCGKYPSGSDDWRDIFEACERMGIETPEGSTSKSVNSNAEGDDPEQDPENMTQHDKLLKIAERADLFRTPSGRRFGKVKENGTPHVYEIRESGGQFRNWMVRKYRDRWGRGPGTTAISRTMTVMNATAAGEDTPERKIFTRVADPGDGIYFDLAGNDQRAVEITPGKWKITDSPSVDFWRSSGTGKLPEPTGDLGGIELLDGLLNLDRENLVLFVSWLSATLQKQGPYPVLIPTGPAGSGKSTITKLVRLLIDPAGESGKAVAEDVRESDDLYSIAQHRHVVALDNISKLKRWQSDALSVIATGGGIEKRKLFTDFELATIDTMNPIIMNGIEISGMGSDLLDRSILLEMEAPEERRGEGEFWSDVYDVRAEIIGAICTLAAGAVKRRSDVNLSTDEMTRMADFAEWLKALTPTLQQVDGLEDIDPLEIYQSNRETAGRGALEQDVFGSVLVEFLEDQQAETNGLMWKGSAGDLLDALDQYADESATSSSNFPGSAVAIGKRMKRVKTTLEKVGISHEKQRSRSGRHHLFISEENEQN